MLTWGYNMLEILESVATHCYWYSAGCSPPKKIKWCNIRWEDGNNLTSNLFTLITPLTTHNNTSDICSYKPYTEKEKKTTKKKYNYNNIKK